MGRKRKARGPQEPKGPRELDPADARLGPITTYADVADSEDEYYLNQDEIRFDDGPQSKRQKKLEEEDAFLDDSDEEVLAANDSDDSDADLIAARKQKLKKKAKRKPAESEEEDEDEQEEEEGDSNWWGSSRKEYYDADNIETEADALEEEVEAKRLQQKKLSKMAEEDFVFDQDEWLQAKDSDEKNADVVTEVLADVEITDDMSVEDRYVLLKTRYPEFEHLVNEFQELHPQLPRLQKEAEGKSSKSLAAVKYWVLGCYVAALGSYFALLTSPARDEAGVQKTMDPAELRDHDIMETLMSCRQMWNRVEALKPSLLDAAADSDAESGIEVEAVDGSLHDISIAEEGNQKIQKTKKNKKTKTTKKSADVRKTAEDIEKSLEDLYNLPLTVKKINKAKANKAAAETAVDSDQSDFGEEESLDAKEAAEKAQRKKSLRFYTSQIVQKANKRAGAGRDAGGDMDIPYRERLKDRQARLNAEAERRGKKDAKAGEALGGDDSNDEDAAKATAMRDDEDEYYDMVAAISKRKKTEKADRKAALAAASATDRVVEKEEIGEDGKRKVTYAIEKNKGLTPRRKKENRNPRVKKRKAYDAKMKKLKSMKPVFRAEPQGGYRGVETGIKAGLIKSTKF